MQYNLNFMHFSLFMGIIATIILRKTFYEINAQPTIFSPNLLDQVKSPPYDFSYDTYLYWLAKNTFLEFLIFDKYTIVKSQIIFQKNNIKNISYYDL